MAEQKKQGNLAPAAQGYGGPEGESSFMMDLQRFCELRQELDELKLRLAPEMARIAQEFSFGSTVTTEEQEQPQTQPAPATRGPAPRPSSSAPHHGRAT